MWTSIRKLTPAQPVLALAELLVARCSGKVAENLRHGGGKSPCRWQNRCDLCSPHAVSHSEKPEGCACLRPSIREKLHPVKRAVDIDARRADARVTAVQNVRAVARRIHPRIHDLGCAFLAGGDVLPRPEIAPDGRVCEKLRAISRARTAAASLSAPSSTSAA